MLEWSQNIILSDGEQINLYNTVEDFAKMLNEHLGYEVEKAFREIVEESRLEAESDLYDTGYDDGYDVGYSDGLLNKDGVAQ